MNTNPLRHRQQGVTLLEVLVSILVLSFGLMGLLGFVINGLKMTSSSHYRTIASEQVASIADMINTSQYLAASYVFTTSTSTLTASCLTSTGCAGSATDMPSSEYYLWLANVAALLPNGLGIVCSDSTPGDGDRSDFACDGLGRLSVKVCWNESNRISVSGGGGAGSSASTSTDSCISQQL